jgi:predicted RNA-binding protein with PUA-like domain
MAYWLLKTEPDEYAFQDLERDETTAWTGVKNPQAEGHLRAMQVGDQAVVYHSGEKRAVGIALVVRAAYPDPSAKERICVDVRAVEPLPAPVPLEMLKSDPAFEGSPLVRQGRLSVVPLSPAAWRRLKALALGLAKASRARPRA